MPITAMKTLASDPHKSYKAKVVRITNQGKNQQEELMTIQAVTPVSAKIKALATTKLAILGAVIKVYIDGELI